ncbi:uncharacterized protein LOC141618396 [Silene latifolia]|uniref:uncharacterized protein LOC141618396 n=1 Tax=Silene latifolia TaxID=37657 RepID=UPI003D76D1F6
MLQHFYFPEKFRKWIMGCITSTWFSLKVNGDHIGFFKGASGLKQGDPLSPFLFVMSMEILSRILRGIHKLHQVSYHPKCGRIGLNHMIFADDLMLFVRGDVPSVRAITSSLDFFAKMSGLVGNPDKTNIYMGGIRENIKREILNATGSTEGDFPFRYLGVPLNEGRLNKTMFVDLLSKVQGALNHWTTYKLSYTGKISLINSEGGFNIKEILSWKKCVICKWIWGLINQSDGFWVTWNYSYNIKQGDFWTLQKKSTHSESWRSILQVIDELVAMAGSGDNAKGLLQSCVRKGKLRLHLLYDHFRQRGNTMSWTKAAWNRALLPKHSFFLVMVMQRKLATIDQLNIRGLYMVNRCTLRKMDNECHKHFSFNAAILLWYGGRF